MRLPAGVETAAQLAARIGPHRALPVAQALAPLLPVRGLERGLVHSVCGDGATSLVYALVAEATATGAWCALVDMPQAGLRAAHEYGVALQRTVCIDTDHSPSSVGAVIGALVEGFDIVVVRDPACTPADARKVASRAKAQGSVLVVHGRWSSFAVDVELAVHTRAWGFSVRATERTVEVEAAGRRVHGPRRVSLLLPSSAGRAASA
ncbi:MAG: hypothetical protein ACKOFF_03035 [Acidimicrobiales bacterium]